MNGEPQPTFYSWRLLENSLQVVVMNICIYHPQIFINYNNYVLKTKKKIGNYIIIAHYIGSRKVNIKSIVVFLCLDP